jgi:hypothetical protein
MHLKLVPAHLAKGLGAQNPRTFFSGIGPHNGARDNCAESHCQQSKMFHVGRLTPCLQRFQINQEPVTVPAATAVLAMMRFPTVVSPEQVPAESAFRLGLYYAPTLFKIWMPMLASIGLYRIDHSRHGENPRILAKRQE